MCPISKPHSQGTNTVPIKASLFPTLFLATTLILYVNPVIRASPVTFPLNCKPADALNTITVPLMTTCSRNEDRALMVTE